MKYNSVNEMLKELKKNEKKHPIKYFFSCKYYDIINLLKDIPRYIRMYYQRAKRGYSDCDVWNFNDYLVEIIVGGLKQLKKYKQGIPTDIYEKYKPNEKKAHQEWNKILNIMIDGFNSYLKMNETRCWNKERYNKLQNKFKKGMKLFGERFYDLWD